MISFIVFELQMLLLRTVIFWFSILCDFFFSLWKLLGFILCSFILKTYVLQSWKIFLNYLISFPLNCSFNFILLLWRVFLLYFPQIFCKFPPFLLSFSVISENTLFIHSSQAPLSYFIAFLLWLHLLLSFRECYWESFEVFTLQCLFPYIPFSVV